MKLSIIGTSGILPTQIEWNMLAIDHRVDFGDFGGWISALYSSDDCVILWVVFLEDLFTPELVEDLVEEKMKMNIVAVLEPLVYHLETSNQPTLVAYSGWRQSSVISHARCEPAWNRLSCNFEITLKKLIDQFSSLYIVDLDSVFAEHGLINCFDSRNRYGFGCRLSSLGISLLADSANRILDRLGNSARKVLVVDCDDTLWGGVLGEVGIGGISLGTDGVGMAYRDIQRSIKRWTAEGVLLAIASKNDEELVWTVFDDHPEMQFRRRDLTAWRVNWDNKAANLIAIAKELDLGLESFVFIDNSCFERQQMRQALPQVFVPELPDDITAWPAFLDSMDALAQLQVSEDDRTKTELYKRRTAFVSGLTGADDIAGFLKSTGMQPEFLLLAPENLARAEQLCQKTNQFNLRTMRYTLAELSERGSDENCLSFLVSLTDRFGSHGMVGLVIAFLRGEAAFLDSFILSCRVLGRHLEAWVLQELTAHLKSANCKWLLAEFLPTERNSVARSFLPDHGLAPLEWERLPSVHPVQNMRNRVSTTGLHFLTDLRTLEVPHLEVFES